MENNNSNITEMKFSVLMSLYHKEKDSQLRQCLDSLLNQTVLPDEIVIVKDGPLTEQLDKTIDEYVAKNPDLYTIVPLEKNQGLGLALAEGIKHCRNELVARMDTDDISVPNRFELQLKEFAKDPELDICGGHIKEFGKDPNVILSIRKVPLTHDEIVKYQKKRDAFNHVSVMFKKSKVLAAGNYQHCLLMEDTLLWANMLMNGAKGKNIDEYLVLVRTDESMFERRGGWDYVRKYAEGRKKVYETGFINIWEYYYPVLVQVVFALVPNGVRETIYRKLLRTNNEE